MNFNIGDFEILEVLKGEKPLKVNVNIEIKNLLVFSGAIFLFAFILILTAKKMK